MASMNSLRVKDFVEKHSGCKRVDIQRGVFIFSSKIYVYLAALVESGEIIEQRDQNKEMRYYAK